MNPFVYIIVLNWNLCEDTVACLETLSSLKYPNYQILLIDNASHDNTVDVVQTRFPDVYIIVNKKNLGFAGGSNVGIQYALQNNAEYILMLNNDTEVASNLLNCLIEASRQESSIGITIPKIYYYSDPQRVWSAGARWRQWPPRVTMIGFNQPDDGSFDHPCSLEYATGCAMLIHRSVFEQVGLLDEAFFMYQEDYEFCYRVRQAGIAIRYVPTAVVWHKVSVSTGEGSPQKWRLWSESVVTFYRKRYRWYGLPLTVFILWVVARELVKGKFTFIAPLLQGIWIGIKTIH